MIYQVSVIIHMLKICIFVFSDLLQNPLIVPLKRLSNHESYNDFGIFDVVFHPTQPWVFSSGADKTVRLYTWHHSVTLYVQGNNKWKIIVLTCWRYCPLCERICSSFSKINYSWGCVIFYYFNILSSIILLVSVLCAKWFNNTFKICTEIIISLLVWNFSSVIYDFPSPSL